MKVSGFRMAGTRRVWGMTALALAAMGSSLPLLAQSRLQGGSIVVASTTSTEQSGLFGHVLPEFSKASGIAVKVVALGTGQAIDMARRGDADVLFVHDRPAEDRFVADGFAARRFDVMYNDFVLVGPKPDPAQARGKDIVAALQKIAASNVPFVSRGDRSGTHAAELRYWKLTGSATKGSGYRECGCGMGPALNMAAANGSYLLADRGSWLSFRNKSELALLVEGDQRLFNQYGVMLVSSARHPHVKSAEGQRFVDWVLSPAGQTSIASYRINGEQLFFPNASR